MAEPGSTAVPGLVVLGMMMLGSTEEATDCHARIQISSSPQATITVASKPQARINIQETR